MDGPPVPPHLLADAETSAGRCPDCWHVTGLTRVQQPEGTLTGAPVLDCKGARRPALHATERRAGALVGTTVAGAPLAELLV